MIFAGDENPSMEFQIKRNILVSNFGRSHRHRCKLHRVAVNWLLNAQTSFRWRPQRFCCNIQIECFVDASHAAENVKQKQRLRLFFCVHFEGSQTSGVCVCVMGMRASCERVYVDDVSCRQLNFDERPDREKEEQEKTNKQKEARQSDWCATSERAVVRVYECVCIKSTLNRIFGRRELAETRAFRILFSYSCCLRRAQIIFHK